VLIRICVCRVYKPFCLLGYGCVLAAVQKGNIVEQELKKAELRGYSKGYTAGLKRKSRERQRDHVRQMEASFFNRALLESINFVMTQDSWKRGEKPIKTVQDRMALARDIANEAVKNFRY
jgi:hypothetical protein